MPRLLLLAGSEAIDAASAAQHAHAQILAVGLQPGDVVLLRGETQICAHAHAFAKDQGLHVISMRLDGIRRDDGTERGQWYDSEKALMDAVSWPLQRDKAMVEVAAKARQAGWDAQARVIFADDDYAGGTRLEHLARVCKDLSVPCEADAAGDTVTEAMDAAKAAPPAAAALDAPGDFDIVFIDLETTGLSNKHHAIIQIGALHCDRYADVIRREYNAKIKPPPWVLPDAQATAVNGYDPAKWVDAPESKPGIEAFLAWLPKSFVLANQSTAFDRNFIAAACRHYQLPEPGWHKKHIDTKLMAQRQLVVKGIIPDAKLATICTHFGVSNEGAHDALSDVKRARAVFLRMSSDIPEDK